MALDLPERWADVNLFVYFISYEEGSLCVMSLCVMSLLLSSKPIKCSIRELAEKYPLLGNTGRSVMR